MSVNRKCPFCRRLIRGVDGWVRTNEGPRHHLNCDRARLRALEDAIERIWGETAVFATDNANEIAGLCHEIAHKVRIEGHSDYWDRVA